MNNTAKFEDRASSSRSKHEGESSHHLCDRLSRTRDFSQRQLPTDQDYAVSTREYQTDQSSLKPAPTAARPVLERQQKQRQRQKQPHRFAGVDRVTPYQVAQETRAALATRTAALSGSQTKAPGSAGGYLRTLCMNDSLEVKVLYPT